MSAQIIDGKLIAQQVREEVAKKAAGRNAAGKPKPTLATVVPTSERRSHSGSVVSSSTGMKSVWPQYPVDLLGLSA